MIIERLVSSYFSVVSNLMNITYNNSFFFLISSVCSVFMRNSIVLVSPNNAFVCETHSMGVVKQKDD